MLNDYQGVYEDYRIKYSHQPSRIYRVIKLKFEIKVLLNDLLKIKYLFQI